MVHGIVQPCIFGECYYVSCINLITSLIVHNTYQLIHTCACGHFSCIQHSVILWTVTHQAPLSKGFSRQEYWNGSPCPPPGDLPNPRIEPTSLMSPVFASRPFLVAQLVKNLPAMQETWVRSLGWEDSLEKGKSTHSSILAWEIPYSPWGRKESDTTERLSLHFTCLPLAPPGKPN